MRIEEEIKQKKFKSEYHKVALNLIYTSNWIQLKQNRMFKSADLSAQQYNILRILRGQHPNAANLGLIQERMLDKNSNASRLVEKLKLKKLVDRKESKADRRQVDIEITEKGLQLLKELDVLVDESEILYKTISEEEAVELNRILDKLRG
jgi:DNA-binding MarR family transcriptional regulator